MYNIYLHTKKNKTSFSFIQFQLMRHKVSFCCNDNTITTFAGNQSSLKLFLHALFLIFDRFIGEEIKRNVY